MAALMVENLAVRWVVPMVASLVARTAVLMVAQKETN